LSAMELSCPSVRPSVRPPPVFNIQVCETFRSDAERLLQVIAGVVKVDPANSSDGKPTNLLLTVTVGAEDTAPAGTTEWRLSVSTSGFPQPRPGQRTPVQEH
jgi:hypothetical protein